MITSRGATAAGLTCLCLVAMGCGGDDPEVVIGEASEALATGALLPDIREEVPRHLNIQNQQQREMLRFSSTHWNTGQGHLRVRGGGQIAPCTTDGVDYDECTHAMQELLDASGNVVATSQAGVAVFHPEHKHWHQSSVADFVLRAGTLTGAVVAQSLKVTFCLIDLDKSYLVHANSTRVYWECNGDLQGISPGWGDEYHHSTEGQELDITGIPAGIYYLVNVADPLNKWIESDDTNNTAWVKFQLSRKGANPEITILANSPCDEITCGNTSNK